MGYYRITVEGCGAHHNNNNPADADIIAKEFVAYLSHKGQHLTKAEFQLTDYRGEPAITSAGDEMVEIPPTNLLQNHVKIY